MKFNIKMKEVLKNQKRKEAEKDIKNIDKKFWNKSI